VATPATSTSGHVTRVALALRGHVIREADTSRGRTITIGHAPACDFVLPLDPVAAMHALVTGDELSLPPSLDGRVVLGGTETTVAALRAEGRTTLRLGAEDWGVLWLLRAPEVRLVVLRVAPERVPPMPSDGANRPLFASIALSAVALGMLLGVAFLRYDPDRPELTLDQLDERFSRAIFNNPPRDELPPPEEEPEISDEDKPAETARKRAGGDEGRYGRPELQGRSNVPKAAGPSTNATNVGLVREMNALAQSDQLADLLSVGGAISGTDTGPLVLGNGSGGMGTRGSGTGGGGEGEGNVYGTADVDLGGSGNGNRRGTAKPKPAAPKERQVSVTTGTAKVKGQLSKELIDKEVRRHRPQISFCYNAQLTRKPDLAGKVTLSWIIRLDGSVTAAKVKSSSLGNSDAESCMVRALGGWRFPKPEGGVVEVEYPFVFDAK
jgi:hypothetical protein